MQRPLLWMRVLCAAWLGVVALAQAAGAAESPEAKTPVERGVLHGYPKGKYQPNKAVTRLELGLILARTQRAIQSDANADPKPKTPRQVVSQPNAPASRLYLALQLSRLLRAIEKDPNAAQQAARPKQAVGPASLPTRIPKWARADLAFLVERGFPVSLPHLYRDLGRPALQKDVTAALTWALGSLAARGYLPPGDLAPPPPEPEPNP